MRDEFSDVDEFPSISLKIRHDAGMNSFTANKLSSEFDSFNQRHAETFGSAYMGVDLRKSGIKVRGVEQYECRINMVTDKGLFHATSKGLGAVKAVHEALKEIELQVEKKKAKFESRIPSRDDYPSSVLEEN